MRLELLLLVAAAFPSCLSRRNRESGHDSRLDSQNYRRDSRDSRLDSQNFPQDYQDSRLDSRLDFWDSPQDSRQDFQDSPQDSQNSRQDSRHNSSQDSRGSPQDSRQDSRDSRQDSRQDSQDYPQDSPQDSRGSPHDSPQDSRWDSQGSHLDSPQDSPQDSRGSPQDSPQNSRDSQGSPQDSRGSSQDSRLYSRGSQGSPQNSRDSQGSPQNSRDSQGSPQDSRGSQGSPQDSRGSRRRPALPPRLLPAPLILQLPPDPPGPPRLRCLAPRRFSGSTFELLPGIPGEIPAGMTPVRSVAAAPQQHWAEFPVPGAARCWRCRYRSHNGSAWLESEPSAVIGGSDLGDAECQSSDVIGTGPAPTAGTLRDRNDPPWLLPVSLGAAVLGLLLLLGAAAAGWRGLRRRGQIHTVPAPSLPMAPAPSLSR